MNSFPLPISGASFSVTGCGLVSVVSIFLNLKKVALAVAISACFRSVDRADELVPFADFRRVILCDGMRAGERRIDLLEPQEGGARGSNIGLFRFPQAED